MKKKNNVLKMILLILITCIYLIPIVMMVLGSLKPKEEAIRFDLSLPSVIEWSNYTYVLEKGHVLTGYFNSFIMTAAATVLVLLFGALAGIYVGRSRGRVSTAIYNYFILGLTVSFQIATTFALLKFLNLYGSRVGVVLIYAAIQLPFTVMTFSSFIKGVPREIDEAAMIDGCGPLRLIFLIIMPIMKPIMITNLIVTAIQTWNNFMITLFYLDSSEKWTIPLMVYNFFGQYAKSWNLICADILLTCLPVIIMYLVCQKYIVGGQTAGAVKG